MSLSLDSRPSEEQAMQVIHAALDAGVTFFDTADVYCTSDEEIGHNERLLRRALDSYSGDADTSDIVVATKGIMSRPGGAWVASSEPDHLFAACDRSLEALGVSTLDLYYLHTPSGFADDDLKFARACRNLQRLQQEGKIRHVGLSNVSYEQLVASQAALEVAAVQNRCNLFDATSFQDGVVGHCKSTGVAFVPYSPVGGRTGHEHAAARRELQPICERLDCSPYELMLSWLLQIDDCIIPVPGATRVPTIASIAACARFEFPLQDEEIVQFLRPQDG
jgi:aryl-alcohol dehydrogenase-like predicted oxidoreductase